MIKTIIAIADIHIRPLKRHEEFKEQFNKFIKEVIKYKPDRVVIAGDLFHSKIIISNEMSQIMAKFLNTLSLHTKVIVIPGNHDAIINSNRLDSISPIVEMLDKDNIIYYKESGVYIDKWDNELAFAVWSCLENQKTPDIEEFLKENRNKIKSLIGLYHGVVNGSSTDIGFTFTDEGVDPEEFKLCDIVITGDIHKHQVLYTEKHNKKKVPIILCGSLLQQDFGELIENHGYVFLNYNQNGEWEIEHNEIETDYGFFTMKINSSDDIDNL